MTKTDKIFPVLERCLKEAMGTEASFSIKLSGAGDELDYQSLKAKPIHLKKGVHLQVVYSHETKDITKNYTQEESAEILRSLIKEFRNVQFANAAHIWQWDPKKEKLLRRENKNMSLGSYSHDHQKQRLIPENRPYLKELGITSSSGRVKKDRFSKYRQINKYIEIINPLLKELSKKEHLNIVDMGSGKGYLTFGLYDYLSSQNNAVEMRGIELRKELVHKCNEIGEKLEYDGLKFESSRIEDIKEGIDVLIALHACDTATDDAIAAGIHAGAELIVCSPCCHKQVRKDMIRCASTSAITQYGILEERQAELVTDTIRALVMNHFGYRTKIMEFVSTEHTPKNLLLIGEKTKAPKNQKTALEESQRLKELFGIKEHYLERIMGVNQN